MAKAKLVGAASKEKFTRKNRPRPASFPSWAEAALPRLVNSIASRGDTFVVTGVEGEDDHKLLWLRDGKATAIKIPKLKEPDAALSHDGQALLVYKHLDNQVHECTVGGKPRALLTGGDDIYAAAYTRTGMVTSTRRELRLYAKVGDKKPTDVLEVGFSGEIVSVHGGDAVVMVSQTAVKVFDTRRSKLKVVASLEAKWPFNLTHVDDRVFFMVGSENTFRELTGFAKTFG